MIFNEQHLHSVEIILVLLQSILVTTNYMEQLIFVLCNHDIIITVKLYEVNQAFGTKYLQKLNSLYEVVKSGIVIIEFDCT